MAVKVKSEKELISLIRKVFGKSNVLEVETTSNEVIIRKSKTNDVIELTKGTIKNIDLKTIKAIAEGEEFCG